MDLDGIAYDREIENGSKSMRFASDMLNNYPVLVPDSLYHSSHLPQFYPIGHYTSIPSIPINKQFKPNLALVHFLSGRHLLRDELPFPLQELHTHYVNGYLQIEPGIQTINGKVTCMRCGSQQSFSTFSCARCQSSNCHYCRNCIIMGKVTFCSPLYSSTYKKKREETITLQWSGKLSEGQKEASNAVIRAIQTNQSVLIWAVCGSGKTEVLFHGLAHALSEQKSVCIATPRTDVVLELTPRLESVFPGLTISPLYGGNSQPSSSFVISTTHQLIRYKDYFDVMIIDEVDAFPYNINASLQHHVNKARKQSGSLIYLTATPSQLFLKQENLQVVRIPSRYHGSPLPVPTFKWVGNWKKKIDAGKAPQILMDWIKRQMGAKKPILVFLPSIKMVEKVKNVFDSHHLSCEFVHSEDEDRAAKVLQFRKKEIPILLSSTILERGITIENVAVAVLGAEDDVFTESALVQIAGRAGRSASFPEGDVSFFHYGKTNAMIAAGRHIRKMNQEAKARGWLK
ncbi:DEAD/DEAH box helicase [Bacillus sp. RAR_GA_16]|uniref:DEAD/DEAH box helicase n=1 Tax=Bacillus sp. RAR_GA_16 TaxID=2876774 RepID=UPI001CCE8CB1|nr:DEAD/DEAH box helicase [Bacillus sp. RAR_GA_16]MCA0172782.1 DEAD/DEAH box helicase [Bacillus sp. RAR_GA_16]